MLRNEIFEKEVSRKINFDYLAYTPKDWDKSKKYPLLVFLHGAGERGDDINLVGRHGPFKYAAQGKDYPFVMVGPQCKKDRYWGNYLESLNDFLDEIIEKYNIDTDRIYLTGLSMGGTGTWHWLLANPERFAAAAPVCGSGVCWYACRIANKPIWVTHGTVDATVPFDESARMVEFLKRSGGDPKFTVLEGVNHNAWDYAYTDELTEWFMEQKLK